MPLSQSQCAQYAKDGYLVLPSLFDETEVACLRAEVARLAQVSDPCVFREGAAGTAKTMFRMHEGDGPTASAAFGAASRLPRVLGMAQQLLGDSEVYIHHTKVNMKGAIDGTVWPWHQDFGSWHLDGIVAPDMLTVMVMLNEATEFNGCLYFVPGSHTRGRVDPVWDESTPYKLWTVPHATVREVLNGATKPVAITGQPGDVVVFDCNIIHASGHNLSALDRWQAYFCFNRTENRPRDVPNARPDYVRSQNWAPMALVSDDSLRGLGQQAL